MHTTHTPIPLVRLAALPPLPLRMPPAVATATIRQCQHRAIADGTCLDRPCIRGRSPQIRQERCCWEFEAAPFVIIGARPAAATAGAATSPATSPASTAICSAGDETAELGECTPLDSALVKLAGTGEVHRARSQLEVGEHPFVRDTSHALAVDPLEDEAALQLARREILCIRCAGEAIEFKHIILIIRLDSVDP
jgi:hypothetical protein